MKATKLMSKRDINIIIMRMRNKENIKDKEEENKQDKGWGS